MIGGRAENVPLRLALALSLFAGAPAPANADADPGDVAFYAREVAAASQSFIELLTPAQRAQLLLPFDGMARTRGRDTSQTPAFCAILQWCPVGWGLTQRQDPIAGLSVRATPLRLRDENAAMVSQTLLGRQVRWSTQASGARAPRGGTPRGLIGSSRLGTKDVKPIACENGLGPMLEVWWCHASPVGRIDDLRLPNPPSDFANCLGLGAAF